MNDLKRWLAGCSLLAGLGGAQTAIASADDILTQHCSNCGSVLVGAAHIDHNSIQWVGTTSPASVNAISNSGAFGFTGQATYQGEGVKANEWQFESQNRVTIGGPAVSGLAPKMGFFFAPPLASGFSGLATYQANGSSKSIDLSGTGVDDDTQAPALTLDVELSHQYGSTAEYEQVPCSCVEDDAPEKAHCEYVRMDLGATLRFTLTPRVDSSKLPVTVKPVEYVKLVITAHEIDTPAQGSSFVFREKFQGNSIVVGDYIHHLHPLGPPLTGTDMESSALRTYPILVSVNKPLEILVMNSNDSGSGHIQYSFEIFGHSDFNDTGKYPGSNKTYRVVTRSLRAETQTCDVNSGEKPAIYNISTRALVSTGQDSEIAGFIITGTGSKKVLLKAAGKSLQAYGVDTNLDTSLQVFRVGEAAPIASNNNWQTDPRAGEIPAGAQPGDPSEAALVLDLEPGAYTAINAPADGVPGVGLVSVDDLATQVTSAQLSNISTRALVDTGQNNAIAGFILTGSGKRKVLIKGVGRGLSNYGVSTQLDPVLTVYRMGTSGNALMGSNNNWNDDMRAAEIPENMRPEDITDAALILDLEPGSYTAIMSPSDDIRGVGLVSVDLLD